MWVEHTTRSNRFRVDSPTGQSSDTESVMVDGHFIIRNRNVLTMDEESIIAEADKVGRRIWGQVEAAGPITVPRLSRQQ
jgi:hypothetical protein